MSNIIKIVAVLRAKAGHEKAVKEALLACVEDSRKEQGCTFYDLHSDRSDPQRFVFVEGWKDMAAIDHHKTTAHYLAMGKAVEDLLEHREVLMLDELSL
ncbi:antibiotic biosynthesis monooxygenase [Pseudomonas endophytica]|uniref:Antibiotic biosynthesis monooxygenase n=1 Tax=Pseudomonas endophytica TaxID=1563157 RepID=A0A0Q0XNX3_9PSED|nr:putative quinol monooxygenase [Pseudomonas endophytica]KQB51769.1 antibiotic biosynthesis monooxygenase [Pseudomonas endophytica]